MRVAVSLEPSPSRSRNAAFSFSASSSTGLSMTTQQRTVGLMADPGLANTIAHRVVQAHGALIVLPALRLRAQVIELVITLLPTLSGATEGIDPTAVARDIRHKNMVQQIDSVSPQIGLHGPLSQLRMLTGMVRGNQPFHLPGAMSGFIIVGVGVTLTYLILFLGLLALSAVVVDSGFLAAQLEQPAHVLNYLDLSWLAASLGTLAGALGSNFDSDEAIRKATYSLRWHERRKMFDTYEESTDDQD